MGGKESLNKTITRLFVEQPRLHRVCYKAMSTSITLNIFAEKVDHCRHILVLWRNTWVKIPIPDIQVYQTIKWHLHAHTLPTLSMRGRFLHCTPAIVQKNMQLRIHNHDCHPTSSNRRNWHYGRKKLHRKDASRFTWFSGLVLNKTQP